MLGSGRSKAIIICFDMSAVLLQAPENEKVLTCGALLSDATELPQDHMVRCMCAFVLYCLEGHRPCTGPHACLAEEAPIATSIQPLCGLQLRGAPTASPDGLALLTRSFLLSSRWA